MGWFELRPTFEIPIQESRDTVIAKLLKECQSIGEPTSFFMHGEYGELHLPPEEHRLWSPHLSFYVADRRSHPVILGRFAPRLEVWTFVWVLYLAMAFVAFFSLVLAYSQWAIGEASFWHWVGLVALVSILVLYIVAHLGQQWSADQMHLLRERLEAILDAADVR